MKRMMIGLLGALALVGCRERTQTQDQQTGEAMSAVGTIVEVQGDSVTIRTNENEMHDMSFGNDTQVMNDDRPVGRDALQEGSQVRATWSTQGEEKQLMRLDVLSGAVQEQPNAQPDQVNPDAEKPQPGSMHDSTPVDPSPAEPDHGP